MENTTDSGTVTLALRITVDATDLVQDRGRKQAVRLLLAALASSASDVEDLLTQSLTEVADTPVAVRAVKAVRLRPPRRTSIVALDHHGRYHTLVGDTQSYCMHALYDASTGMSDEELDAHLEDEEAYDAGLKAFEEKWLREHGVTHIVDTEDFDDGLEHTLEEYLSL